MADSEQVIITKSERPAATPSEETTAPAGSSSPRQRPAPINTSPPQHPVPEAEDPESPVREILDFDSPILGPVREILEEPDSPIVRPPPRPREPEEPESPVLRPTDLDHDPAPTPPEEEEYTTPSKIVIIGGGIIGVCTAYYITRHHLFDPSKTSVTLLEASSIASGASGTAGGLLALNWHDGATSGLGELSYSLHRSLAEEHAGRKEWGYRELTTLDLKCEHGKNSWGVDIVPNWIDGSVVRRASTIGQEDTTSQVHPRLFTKKLMNLAEEKGCKLEYGLAKEILFSKYDNGSIKTRGVKYRPGKLTPKNHNGNTHTAKPEDTSVVDDVEIEADCVIVAAGPWTSRVLEEIPITCQRAHSITISTSEPVSAHALFTTIKTKSGLIATPEIYSRPDEVYVCGETDTNDPLPEYASDVNIVESRCDTLKTVVGEISELLKDGEVTCKQACYLPYCGPTGPAIGWVPDMGGVLVAAGHSVWGICNGPGTGKVVSEMCMGGKALSADVAVLGPERFF